MINKPKFRVAVSNENMPPLAATLFSAQEYREFVARTGADGIEVTPTRGRVLMEATMGIGNRALRDSVILLRQSQRKQRLDHRIGDSMQVRNFKGLARDAVQPPSERSVHSMYRIQKACGRLVPASLEVMEDCHIDAYTGNVRSPAGNYRFGQTRWEPTASVLHELDFSVFRPEATRTNIGYVCAIAEIDKVAFDPIRWTADHVGITLPPWQETLGPMIDSGLCVSARVVPVLEGENRRIDHLKQIIDGDISVTEQGELLRIVKDSVPQAGNFDVVIDMPYHLLNETGVQGMSYVDINAKLVEQTRGILNSPAINIDSP